MSGGTTIPPTTPVQPPPRTSTPPATSGTGPPPASPPPAAAAPPQDTVQQTSGTGNQGPFDPVGQGTSFPQLGRAREQFQGSPYVGTGDPNNPVLGTSPGTTSLPGGWRTMDYNTLNQQVNSPDQVAGLMGVVEDEEYDAVRGQPLGGDGPLGAQSPETTWDRFTSTDPDAGVCRDIHQLGAALLPDNYQARQIGYVAGRTSHSLLSYRDPNGGGYGIIEYGTHYTPQDIAARLGRPATSYEEALMVIRPEAKVIFRWTEPNEGEVGHVEKAFYTPGYRNYFESLNLNFGQDQVAELSTSYDTNRGLRLDYSPDSNWRFRLGYDPLALGDPTGRNSLHAVAGYHFGDQTDWLGVSLGVHHRPNEGAGVIGTNQFWSNPTTLIGLNLNGSTEFLRHNYTEGVYGAFHFGGNAGIGLPFNHQRESDAGTIVNGGYGFDNDLMTGMIQANAELSYDFHADLAPGLTLESSLFAAPDVYLTAAAVGMGAERPFGNIGMRNSLQYETGDWNLEASQQTLFHQDNNLQEDGARFGVGYNNGTLSWSAGAQWMDSVEGSRLGFDTHLGVLLTETLRLNAGLRHSQIFADDADSSYTVPGETQANFGLQADF